MGLVKGPGAFDSRVSIRYRGPTMRCRGGLIVLAVCLMLVPAAAEARRNVYITSSSGQSKIAILDISPTGTLSPVGTPATVSGPQGVAMTPDGKHLYVGGANGGIGTVGRFIVAADGSLSAAAGVPTQTGMGPLTGIAVTPDGTRLYVLQTVNNEFIRGFSVGANGSLSAIPGASASLGNPAGIAVTPDGQRLYVSQNNTDQIRGYTINADGSLAQLVNSPFPLEAGANFANQIAITPSGTHLYVTGTNAPHTISAFSIAANGSLSLVTGGPFPAGVTSPAGVWITPDGKGLYTASADSANVAAFTLGAGGIPSPLGAVASAGAGSGLASTPDSKRLYVAPVLPQTNATGYDIGATGALSLIPGGPLNAGVDSQYPQSMAITPNQGPTAAFTPNPLPAGFPSVMDGSTSADPDGTVTRFLWDFGDGTTLDDGTATPSHTYAAPGIYTVTLTVTDSEGCSTAFVFTGQTASCNGGAKATTSHQVVISDGTDPALKLSGKKNQRLDPAIEVGARCDEACTVRGQGQLVVTRPSSGSEKRALRGKRQTFKLRPRSLSLAAGTRGILRIRVPIKTRRSVSKALNDGGRAIARITIRATDGAGNTSKQKRRIRLNTG